MLKSEKMTKTYIFLGLAILLIAAGSLIYGINDRLSFIEKSNNYYTIEATVIDYDYKKTGEAAEVIEYTVNKNVYVKTLTKYSNNPKDITDKIVIKYNPANPDDIIYNDSYVMYIIIFFAFIALSISVIIIVKNYLVIKYYETKK